jgi:hypothetical protein
VDDVRVRRNQQRAAQATGDRLSEPLREDLLGRLSLTPLQRMTLPSATSGATLGTLEGQVNELLDRLSALVDDMVDRGYMQ